MKCSIYAITAGDAAYAAEVNRLQVARVNGPQNGRDPFLYAEPGKPRTPCEVEMLLTGLREIEREGE